MDTAAEPGSERPAPEPTQLPGAPTIAVIAVIAVIAALTVAVMAHPAPLPGELGYLRWLQRRVEPVPSIARFVRATTSTEATLVVGAVSALWLLRRRGRAAGAAIVVALIAMLIIQPLFKEVVDRPRPTAEQVEVRAVHSSKSFPSGHSMSTTTVWGALVGLAALDRRRALAAAAAVPIVLTGLASGVQGVHWPTDAIAGTLTGGLAALAIVRLLRAPTAPTAPSAPESPDPAAGHR